MGTFKEYDTYDGIGLAELIQKGDISPQELSEEAISRIEKVNPRLGAVVFPMFDIGRETAAGPLPDGPFFGVPFLLKDLLAAYAGVPMTGGCRALKNFVPDFDSEIVRRLKNAGLVILGKTNTPEFGLKGVTEPELFGPCRNPWNTDHTRAVPAAGRPRRWLPAWFLWHRPETAADPSAFRPGYCGLFGIKPSRAEIRPARHTAVSGRTRSRNM